MTRVKYAIALLGLVGMFTGTPARGQSYPVYWDVGQDSYRWAQNLIDFATETWVLLQGFVSTADPDWNADDWNEAFGWGDHDGLYLSILGTAHAAYRLTSEDGNSWIDVAGGTGTIYRVSYDTNTIVAMATSPEYNGPIGPWLRREPEAGYENEFIEAEPSEGQFGLLSVIISDSTIVNQWALGAAHTAAWEAEVGSYDLPVVLRPLYAPAAGSIRISYLPTTNSVDFIAIADDYYDKATTDFRIATAVAEIEPDPAIRDSLWYITTEGYLSPKTEPIDFGDHWELSDGDWGYLVTTDNVTADVLWRVNEFGDLVANHEVSP